MLHKWTKTNVTIVTSKVFCKKVQQLQCKFVMCVKKTHTPLALKMPKPTDVDEPACTELGTETGIMLPKLEHIVAGRGRGCQIICK